MITEGATYSPLGSIVSSEVYCVSLWHLSNKFFHRWDHPERLGSLSGGTVVSIHVTADHMGNRSYSVDFSKKVFILPSEQINSKLSLRFSLPVDRPNEAHDFEMLFEGSSGGTAILVSDTPIDLTRRNFNFGRYHRGSPFGINHNHTGWLEELLNNVRKHDENTFKARKAVSTTGGIAIRNRSGGDLKYKCGNKLFYRTLPTGQTEVCDHDADVRVVRPGADGSYDFASYFHFDKRSDCIQKGERHNITFKKVWVTQLKKEVPGYFTECKR